MPTNRSRNVLAGGLVLAIAVAWIASSAGQQPPAKVPGVEPLVPRRMPAMPLQPETLPAPPVKEEPPQAPLPPGSAAGEPKAADDAAGPKAPPPGLAESLRRLAADLPRETDVERMTVAAGLIADVLAEWAIQGRETRRDGLEETIDELWTAANLRAEAARLASDSAGHRAAVASLVGQLEKLREQSAARVEAGVSDAASAHLAAYHDDRAAALAARLDGDRPGQIAEMAKALAEAEALVAARQAQAEAGRVLLPSLIDAARCRYDAAAALAGLTTADAAQVRKSRAAALEALLRVLQTARAATDRAAELGARQGEDAALVGFMTEKYSALLARELSDGAAEAAAWRGAVSQGELLLGKAESQYAAGAAPAAVVLDASKYLEQARVELARQTASAAEFQRARREAFVAHRTVAESVLEKTLARYEAGRDGGKDLAYAAARTLWIRLQIAGMDRSAAGGDDPAYRAVVARPAAPEAIPAPTPEPARQPVPAGNRDAALVPCPFPVIVVPCPW